jgi:hypothetical protein
MKLDGSDRRPITSRNFDLMPAWGSTPLNRGRGAG